MRLCKTIAVALALWTPQASLAGDYAEPSGPLVLQADLRASIVGGERGWRSGGFGKLLHGGDGDEAEPRLEIAEASLLIAPDIGWTLKPHIQLQAAPYQDEPVDVVEAYLRWRPTPKSATRFSARAGVFFPPVSLEHDGIGWSVTRTITPSAVNTWIAEEVLVAGVEATVERRIGDSRLALTLGGFDHNDTSGTLLSYRGWALHDARATMFNSFMLPDGPTGWRMLFWSQAPRTDPFREIDGRLGFYGKLALSVPEAAGFELFGYDNRGDAVAAEEGQYSWATRFLNAAAWAKLGPDTEILAQGMYGETIAGTYRPGRGLADVDFGAAYLLLSHASGRSRFAGRLDWFETRGRSYEAVDNNDEQGWAATLAWRRALDARISLAAEALYVTSDRPSRSVQGLAPEQDQLIAQAAVRLQLGR